MLAKANAVEKLIWVIDETHIQVDVRHEPAAQRSLRGALAGPGLWTASVQIGQWGATVYGPDRSQILANLEQRVRDWLASRRPSLAPVPEGEDSAGPLAP